MTTSALARLFGRSPFGPIQEHMKTVLTCCERLPDLIDGVESDDDERASHAGDKIHELGERARHIKNDLLTRLPRSLLLPVDRRDLVALLLSQDAIANAAREVADLIATRPDGLPDPLRGDLGPIVASCVESVRQSRRAVDRFDELLETGFHDRSVELVEEALRGLDSRKAEADRLGIQALGTLVAAQRELEPGTFWLWAEVLQRLRDVSKHVEAVGSRFRLLIAK